MKVANLAQFRRARGLTQQALALKVGVTQPYLAMLEQGRRNPTLAVLRRLADVLNTSVSALVGETRKDTKMKVQIVSESTVRRLAQRAGYYLRKSRAAPSYENQGQYALMKADGNYPVLGWHYDATLEDIREWLSND